MGLSKAKFLGHPVHQMLIVFPLAARGESLHGLVTNN